MTAADQAPGAIEVVRVAVSGLLETGKAGTARRVLAKAQFLRPGCAELAALGARIIRDPFSDHHREHRFHIHRVRRILHQKPLFPSEVGLP